MTHAELELHRRHLLTALARLRGDLSQLADEALEGGGGGGSNLSHMPLHMADLASDASEEDMTFGLLESQGQTLSEVRDALARVDRGTFGRCEECQGEVGAERLEALPYARHCVGCARRVQAEGLPGLGR
jgi:RNA polymerase-binding transcription factor DksA